MERNFSFMFFFLIVISVLTLVNLFIYYHTRNLFPHAAPYRWGMILLFWLVAVGYFAGRIIERAGAGGLAAVFIKAGSWWLGAMVYLALLFLLLELFRGITFLAGSKGFFSFSWVSEKGRWISAAVYLVTAVVLVAGYVNALHPVVRVQPVRVNKPVPEGTYRAVLVSDIHLGMMIGNSRLQRIVEKINSLDADVLLLAGDIFDEDLGPVIRNNNGELLRNLKTLEGVYAVLGNHEFYGNAAAAERYLRDHRITVLRDSLLVLPSGVTLVGREDRASQQVMRRERKPLAELLEGADTGRLVIVMDHQPYDLSGVAAHPVDLQVSGHTHHGQLWPLNYITRAVYEISKGYGKIEKTHFYVSPGVGTWGPVIRTSSRPEIILLEITGE